MDSMVVLGSNNFLLHKNVQIVRHRSISGTLGMPVSGIEKRNQTGLYSLPSLRSSSSLITLQTSRKVAMKSASITRTAEPKTATEEPFKEYEINGEVVLHKVAFLNLTDYSATVADEISELMGKKISLELVSSDLMDPGIIYSANCF